MARLVKADQRGAAKFAESKKLAELDKSREALEASQDLKWSLATPIYGRNQAQGPRYVSPVLVSPVLVSPVLVSPVLVSPVLVSPVNSTISIFLE